MADTALIIAESGSGKSTSIETLNPISTFIINVANKPLPFKGAKKKYTTFDPATNPMGNIVHLTNADEIVKCMRYISAKRPEITTLVIDDWQYMSSFEYMDKANEKGYEKFTKIAVNLTNVAREPQRLRDDLTVFFMTHVEESTDMNGNRRLKAKTIGK